MSNDIKQIVIKDNITLKEAMKVIDHGAVHTAMIVDDEGKLQGIVTDGDIKRAILSGVDNKSSISRIINRGYKYATDIGIALFFLIAALQMQLCYNQVC